MRKVFRNLKDILESSILQFSKKKYYNNFIDNDSFNEGVKEAVIQCKIIENRLQLENTCDDCLSCYYNLLKELHMSESVIFPLDVEDYSLSEISNILTICSQINLLYGKINGGYTL